MQRIRLLLIVLLCGSLCYTIAQTPSTSREYFPQLVKNNTDKVCPFTTTTNVTCRQVTCEGNDLHVYLEFPPEMLLGTSASQWRLFFADRLRFDFDIHSYVSPLYYDAAYLGCGLVYHVNDKKGLRHFLIRYSPNSLKQIIGARNTMPYQSISKWQARINVFAHNAFLNQHAGEEEFDTFVQDSVLVHNEAETYFYTMLGDKYFEQLDMMKESILEDIETDIMLDVENYKDVVNAGYSLAYRFFNPSHMDSVEIVLPRDEVKRLLERGKRLVPPDSAFMKRYMERLVQLLPDVKDQLIDKSSGLKELNITFENGFVNYAFTLDDASQILESTPQQQALMRQSMLPGIKDKMFSQIGPEFFGDTVVTVEHFLEYVKGVRFLYIGEHSRKTVELAALMEDIFNAEEEQMMAGETQAEYIARLYQKEEFLQLVKAASDLCPYDGGALTYQSAAYRGHTLFVHADVDTSQYKPDTMEALKEVLTAMFEMDAPALYSSLPIMESDLMFYCRFPDTIVELYFSQQELAEIFNMMNDEKLRMARSEHYLKMIVSNTNLECPVPIEGLGRLDSMALVDGYLVIFYTLEDAIVDGFFMNDKSYIHDLFRGDYLSGDSDSESLLRYCESAGYGICHRFGENMRTLAGKKNKKSRHTPRVMKVLFPVEELQEIVNSL